MASSFIQRLISGKLACALSLLVAGEFCGVIVYKAMQQCGSYYMNDSMTLFLIASYAGFFLYFSIYFTLQLIFTAKNNRVHNIIYYIFYLCIIFSLLPIRNYFVVDLFYEKESLFTGLIDSFDFETPNFSYATIDKINTYYLKNEYENATCHGDIFATENDNRKIVIINAYMENNYVVSGYLFTSDGIIPEDIYAPHKLIVVKKYNANWYFVHSDNTWE